MNQDQVFHHLSIPEISNVNLYNQKPFLKKPSINPEQSQESEQTPPQTKKHFEYGTPIATSAHPEWTPGRLKRSFHKDGKPRMQGKRPSNKKLLTAYELQKLESKYSQMPHKQEFAQHILGEAEEEQMQRKQWPISQFSINDPKAHQSLLDNRVDRKYQRKSSIGSTKRKSKMRSRSKRKNWSKQRIRRELEKFEEELKEEESKQEPVEPEDFNKPHPTQGKSKMGKLGSRWSKRNSVKAIEHTRSKGSATQKQMRIGSSRNSRQAKKGHVRRISSNIDEGPPTQVPRNKMTRSHIRQSHTARHYDHDMSLPIHPQGYNINQGGGHHYTGRVQEVENLGYDARRRKHMGGYLKSSRDMPVGFGEQHGHVHSRKHVRQSYEQNYVPPGPQYEGPWNAQAKPQRQADVDRAQKNVNSNINFDYRNLNANVQMNLPFE